MLARIFTPEFYEHCTKLNVVEIFESTRVNTRNLSYNF